MARSDSVFIQANSDNRSEANQPQDMWIYEGIVLVARCKSNEKHLKNGVRYKVTAITEEEDDDQRNFEMIAVKDDDQETGESFIMSSAELGKNAPFLCHHVLQQPGPHHQWAAATCADVEQEFYITSPHSWLGQRPCRPIYSSRIKRDDDRAQLALATVCCHVNSACKDVMIDKLRKHRHAANQRV